MPEHKDAWEHSIFVCAQAVGFLYRLRSPQVFPAAGSACFPPVAQLIPVSYKKQRLFSSGK